MHHKRKKTKRRVRCTICTKHRWLGNSAGRSKPKEEAKRKQAEKEIKERS